MFKIYFLRGEKVLLDRDLAELYGVETKRLIEAVKRNAERFPIDFMFQLSTEEDKALRTQIATSSLSGQKMGWGGRRYLPFAFTEQGVAMLSSVLNSARAVHVNIAIMRAFVQMRKFLQSNETLAKKLNELEKQTQKKFADQQKQIKLIFDAIKELMIKETKPKRKIGF
ncbi:MAG: ORF6N domain-containing protein [Bacteroidetes bacterium]|nr:ORF6N domain-containing protein [Bacteroidota bacterium]MCL6097098.1 ORF6N domain-containing protein [Bacteroidota bacterium]